MNNLGSKRTKVYVDIVIKKDGQPYHLLNYEVYPENVDVYDDSKLSAIPAYFSFSADKTLETNDEIAEAIVDYLCSLKLYLYSYRITDNRMFVSYARKDTAFSNALIYSPISQTLALYISVEAQMEDGVDYEKELGIKLHHPIDNITVDEIREFGMNIDDYGVMLPALIREDEMPEIGRDY